VIDQSIFRPRLHRSGDMASAEAAVAIGLPYASPAGWLCLKDSAVLRAGRVNEALSDENGKAVSRRAERSRREGAEGLKRVSVQRARIESRRCPADLDEVAQDRAYPSGSVMTAMSLISEPHLGRAMTSSS
jgi:hypothetical protein